MGWEYDKWQRGRSVSEWHQTFIRVLKRASRPDGRCTVKCMLLQKGAVTNCGCISRIEGAYIRIVGASAPTKRYKITPLLVSGSVRTDSRRAGSARNLIASHVNFGDDSTLSAFTRTQWTAALKEKSPLLTMKERQWITYDLWTHLMFPTCSCSLFASNEVG